MMDRVKAIDLLKTQLLALYGDIMPWDTDEELHDDAMSLVDMIMPEGSVLVDQDHLKEMERDAAFLRLLKGAGVDNWEGYQHAVDMRGDDA